ncbi:MAG: hypothetical protein B7X02_03255 [Rhodospirillales bacterium 12-54-5]|nr:MAG: hypothetical protein B7X02_03255 [Rhodospirillales bacterium 12-54-5]
MTITNPSARAIRCPNLTSPPSSPIVSLFAAGEKPTGSKDPLALRRAALGVLRILHWKRWNLDIASFTSAEIVEFFNERLKQLLRDEPIATHIVEAALRTDVTKTFVPALLSEQTKMLAAWLATQTGATTLAAIKRALNILAAEEKKSKSMFTAKGFESLALPAEKALITALTASIKAPADLDALAAPINAFFDAVLVTEPEFRDARLGLLAAVRDAAYSIADFSKIEG